MTSIQPTPIQPNIVDLTASSSTPAIAGCVLPHGGGQERRGITELVDIAEDAMDSTRLDEAIRDTFSSELSRTQATLAMDVSRMSPESQLRLLRELDGSLGTEQQVLGAFGAALTSGMGVDHAIAKVRTIERRFGSDALEAAQMMREFAEFKWVGPAVPQVPRPE